MKTGLFGRIQNTEPEQLVRDMTRVFLEKAEQHCEKKPGTIRVETSSRPKAEERELEQSASKETKVLSGLQVTGI